LNAINLTFKNFIAKMLKLSRTDLLSEEQIEDLDKELSALLNNSNDGRNCKAKSFFTFNQQLDELRYRPVNQDLNKNYELVFSGCSQTHGDHISPPLVDFGDHNYIWGFQVANKYNKEALNLGMGGWSVEAIHKGLMHHFQQNGNPKVLLILLPDFGRMSFVDNEKIRSIHLLNQHELVQHFFIQPWDETEYPAISKAPHYAHTVLPWTQSLYRSLQCILLLDQYCKDNNIYFKYFSWDHNSNIILKLLKKYLPEYSNYSEPDILNTLRLQQINTQLNITCHEDIKDNYPSKIWHNGIDNAHLGIHHHIHVAEQFMKEIDNDNPWN
jgi:hypothetical protein